MIYLYAALVGGLICLIGQLLLDLAKWLPVHITVFFVSLGSLAECFGLYDKLIAFEGGGALMPISSFGHSLTHAALVESASEGYIGLLLGIFDLTSGGITAAILFAFLVALVFKPKG